MSDQNETYVRERWDEPRLQRLYRSAGQMDSGADPDELIIYTAQNVTLAKVWGSEQEAWLAARQFTEERLESIRQVEEEIRLLQGMIILLRSEPGDLTAPIYQRTISRLEAALADLQRGLKPGGSNE